MKTDIKKDLIIPIVVFIIIPNSPEKKRFETLLIIEFDVKSLSKRCTALSFIKSYKCSYNLKLRKSPLI